MTFENLIKSVQFSNATDLCRENTPALTTVTALLLSLGEKSAKERGPPGNHGESPWASHGLEARLGPPKEKTAPLAPDTDTNIL